MFAKIIQNLDPNKAHGYDNISIRMLKIYGSSIYKPLEKIFKQCIETGVFPSEWKKGNIAPIHKNGDTLKNYHPVSLLPICGKIIERLLFNEMFKFFIENKLISSNQTGYKPGDSCINQLYRAILALIRYYLSLITYMNLLMLGLKLETSSLLYEKHLIWCGMMVSSTN